MIEKWGFNDKVGLFIENRHSLRSCLLIVIRSRELYCQSFAW